jgi:hypothetical protein
VAGCVGHINRDSEATAVQLGLLRATAWVVGQSRAAERSTGVDRPAMQHRRERVDGSG